MRRKQEEFLQVEEVNYRSFEKGTKETYYWLFSIEKDNLHPIMCYHHVETRAD